MEKKVNMEADNHCSALQLLLDAATQLEKESNFHHDPGHDHRYALPIEPSIDHTDLMDTNSSITSFGESETLSAFSINFERSGSLFGDIESVRVGKSSSKRLAFSDISNTINLPSSLPRTKSYQGRASSLSKRPFNTVRTAERSFTSSEVSGKSRVSDNPPTSSSKLQLPAPADRPKPWVSPYLLPPAKQFKRVAGGSSDSSGHSSVSQRLADFDPVRYGVSNRSFASSDVSVPDNPSSLTLQLLASADRHKSRTSSYPLPPAKQFKSSSDRSGYSSIPQRLAYFDPVRDDVSNHSFASSDVSVPDNPLSSSSKLQLPASANRPKSRASPYHLPPAKQFKRVAGGSSDRFGHSSNSQRLVDSDPVRYGVSNRSFASSDVSGNRLNVSRITHQDKTISSQSFYNSILRATTSTPLSTRAKESYKAKPSVLCADDAPLDLSVPKISVESGMPIDLVVSQYQNSMNSSYRPMDLRVVKLSDNIINTCDDIENQYEDDVSDVEEEDAEGDPTLLNDFTIYECFEEYRNMHTDDEEFPDSDDEHDFQRKRRSGIAKPKLATGQEDEHSSLNGRNGNGLEENENDTVNTTHHNLEQELHELKLKKVSLRMKNKLLKLKGMSYTKPDGTVVSARSVKKGCDCRMKCAEKYSDAVRKQLLRNLLNLRLSGQNQFIANHMMITKTARPQVVNSRRTYSRSYRLPGVNGMVKVCKVMFMATFDITDRKLRNLAAKTIAGNGVAEDDQRTFNTSHKKVSQDHIEYIKKHIDSFPAYSSHYSREGSEKRYLSSDLNIKAMYELYQEKCSRDNSWIPVHYDTYRIIFKEKNLSFRKPKVDVCGECEKYRIALKGELDSPTKITLTAAHEMHQQAAQRVYEEKRKDRRQTKEDSEYRTVSFDLQKQLPTPHLRCGQAFYARQLYTYNLTFFSSYLDKNTATCMMWDETKAKRGSQEVASCLLRDLKKMPVTIRHVTYYSDRCVGQNLNRTVVFAFAYYVELAARDGRELIIEHKFMRTGHSRMEVDSVHSAIEKAKKKTTIDIEIPHDWVVLISAIRRSVPFDIDEMEQRDFRALKDLSVRYCIPKKNETGDSIKFINIMVFRYSTNSPGTVFYKHDVGDAEFKHMHIISGVELEQIVLNTIEDEPIVLPDAKLADLKGLLPFVKNKEFYQTFLKSLVPSKRGRKPKSNKVDHFENDLDPPESDEVN